MCGVVAARDEHDAASAQDTPRASNTPQNPAGEWARLAGRRWAGAAYVQRLAEVVTPAPGLNRENRVLSREGKLRSSDETTAAAGATEDADGASALDVASEPVPMFFPGEVQKKKLGVQVESQQPHLYLTYLPMQISG